MSSIPPPLAASLGDRYVLEREIGAGGMATVYLAQDLRHKRSVAVKVVRPELGSSPQGVERFLREIELAARLQHPHILPVFDSGSVAQDGAPTPYFVMPFVEGETLRQRLQRDGRLSLDSAIEIAAEVADALAYAHAHGVVHRDIKPENILLTGGHAVVADFGVAKALELGATSRPAEPASRLTRAGLAIGTPHYMSPEQATGEEVVDARSDQYSLACVLYEMLAGEPPFTGPNPQSVMARSLSAPRPQVSRIRTDVPPELERVVLRAMALEPASRYPDMPSMRAALLAARGVPTSRQRRRALLASGAALLAAAVAGGWLATRASELRVARGAELLAVLPFHTSGPGVEFLGEGMVDLLSTNLRGVAGIKTVDPRAVLAEWRSTRRPGSGELSRALAMGRELDAYSVVMGSVVSTGGRVRLAADLHTVDGERLGRAQVDGPADSVLALVDRLSLALLRDVWRSREPLPSLRLASLTTDSIEALRSYLVGERQYRRLAFDSALTAYTRAVEVDSTFALAHLRRAQVFGWTGGYGNPEARRSLESANRFAGRLPHRDRRLLVGYNLFEEGKPAAADTMRAFLETYPEDVEGWFLLGETLFHTSPFNPTPPESISAVFDSVLRRDSSLYPALLHPLELSLVYRDSAAFARYFPRVARTGPPERVRALRTTAGIVWGPRPGDSAVNAALQVHPSWVINAVNAIYRNPAATSDTILRQFRLVGQAAAKDGQFERQSLAVQAHMFAGLGRWRRAKVAADSLRAIDPEQGLTVLAWPIALGLAPASSASMLDSVVEQIPPGPEAEYGRAMLQLLRGQVNAGRSRIARALAAGDSRSPAEFRGFLVAADGWGLLLQGDSARGIQRMREGLDLAAAPGQATESAFFRFQLALALAARRETREEGIRWLSYGFDLNPQPLYIPLTYFALGRAYEAAGRREEAALAYRRFLRFWDKADPELQARVAEAHEALREAPGGRN